MADHPSMFALDMLALGDGPADVRTHVASCAKCQAHVQTLTTGAVLPPDLRVRALESRAGKSGWGWLFGGFAVAAVAALAVIVGPVIDDDGLRTKSAAPALELFVKRGDTVKLWDTQSPVIAGDRLLLRVDSAGYTHTRILAGDAVLFEGALPADRSTPLPVSFKVDDAEGSEHLRIELSGGGRPGWATELELPKANGGGR